MHDIKPTDIKILEALYTFPYLTVQGVTDLLYSYGSFKGVLTTLKRLTEINYLLRERRSMNDPYIFWLAAKGRHYLEDMGYDFTGWRYPSEMANFIHSSHLAHYLGVTDVLIAAKNLYKINPLIQVGKIIHDFELKRTMEGAMLIPDGIVVFQSGDGIVLWIELDNGTEKETEFKSKIRRIVEFMGYNWSAYFDVPPENFTFVFPVRGREHWEVLVKWTEQQLQTMNRMDVAGMFFFTQLPQKFDASIFVSPIWRVPFTSIFFPLLEL